MIIYIDISNYALTRAHTGIQRVVREFLFRLNHDKHSFQYKVIFYDTLNHNFNIINFKELDSFLSNTRNHKFNKKSNTMSINEISAGDIFFDMDGAWNNGLKRTYLYAILKSNKVIIVNFIYDLVPVLLPQYSHIDTVRNFTSYLQAIYNHSDLVFFDSKSAEKDFLSVKFKIGNSKKISTKVVKLGADISTKNSNISNYLLEKKYILFVGTIEPRKDQGLLLSVFDKIVEKHSDINLVFIGRAGWNNDELIYKIKVHPQLNKRIFWLNNISDEELVKFYKNTYINVYLSKYEGFGLPILESLSYENITITSKNSSMYEVGKNFADYVEYNSFNEIYEILDLYLSDEQLYKEKKSFIKNNFISYTWDITYNSIVNVFENLNKNITIRKPNKLQFIFISIDLQNLIGTINKIDKYIDFVKEYIVVTRFDLIESFQRIKSIHEITIIDENKILNEYSKDFKYRDHQSKNWLLRALLLNLNTLDDQFIMLDDDNRPLKKFLLEHFLEDGKYNAYYFYDMLSWSNFQTDYDYGQHSTKKLLDNEGFELLSYSSHKPQIIDKKIFKEVVMKYFETGLQKPIDEWSIYFNYAVSKYPFLFNKIKYDTLNWPAHPSNWKQQYRQDNYNFENYYETNFHGNYQDKIKNKITENKPFLENIQLEKNNFKLYENFNMIYGKLKFIFEDKKIFIFNMPHFIEGRTKSWIKLILNYKMINCSEVNCELVYFVNGKKGAKTELISNNKFEDNNIEFGISCENLGIGEYDILIDCIIDNENIYGVNSPYLIKLFIK